MVCWPRVDRKVEMMATSMMLDLRVMFQEGYKQDRTDVPNERALRVKQLTVSTYRGACAKALAVGPEKSDEECNCQADFENDCTKISFHSLLKEVYS
jgi:hypothetical protein